MAKTGEIVLNTKQLKISAVESIYKKDRLSPLTVRCSAHEHEGEPERIDRCLYDIFEGKKKRKAEIADKTRPKMKRKKCCPRPRT
jgi:hypothetical protein